MLRCWMKWWGAALSSKGEGTAVPTAISLKNCRESAEMISVWKCWANWMARAVFPMAVGPTTAMSILWSILAVRGCMAILPGSLPQGQDLGIPALAQVGFYDKSGIVIPCQGGHDGFQDGGLGNLVIEFHIAIALQLSFLDEHKTAFPGFPAPIQDDQVLPLYTVFVKGRQQPFPAFGLKPLVFLGRLSHWAVAQIEFPP